MRHAHLFKRQNLDLETLKQKGPLAAKLAGKHGYYGRSNELVAKQITPAAVAESYELPNARTTPMPADRVM